jgi:hypothetical protein
MKRIAYNQVEGLTAKLERLAETRATLDGLRARAIVENPAPVYGEPPRRNRAH